MNEKNSSIDHNIKKLHLIMEGTIALEFFEILQDGFSIECQVGVDVKSLLCEELALNPQYIANRISTIFLDGKCVDDIESAIIKSGATIAISAAMPGLAGATLRREGPYASLRSSITYEEKGHPRKSAGICHIKLFNLLINELGPIFLERGILVKTKAMMNFLRNQSDIFWSQCIQLLVNGKPIELSELLKNNRYVQDDFLYVTVNAKT